MPQSFGSMENFYPRPPRGGRQGALSQVIAAAQFLSTPSARRATAKRDKTMYNRTQFLSTPSAMRATFFALILLHLLAISIHALREEGDIFAHKRGYCGAIFLSTPSARRATKAHCRDGRCCAISIHALREEGD